MKRSLDGKQILFRHYSLFHHLRLYSTNQLCERFLFMITRIRTGQQSETCLEKYEHGENFIYIQIYMAEKIHKYFNLLAPAARNLQTLFIIKM